MRGTVYPYIGDNDEPPFVGRSDELALLKALVDAQAATIFVTGNPGVGKTTFIKQFITKHLKPPFEAFDLDFHQGLISSLGDILTNFEIYVEEPTVFVIDGCHTLSPDYLSSLVSRILRNYEVKTVIVGSRSLIRETRNRSLSPEILSAHLINLESLEGALYTIPQGLVVPSDSLGSVLVATNADLIRRLRRAPDDLFKITSRQFEEVIADLLSNMGMEVSLTPATRDGGKDILAYMKTDIGKFLCLVEAKQYNKLRPVGVAVVRSLFGTLVDHQATSALLVTTSRFATPAKEFQERHKYQLSLKDYGDVVSWLAQHERK